MSKSWSVSSAQGWSRPEPWPLKNAQPGGWFRKCWLIPSSFISNCSNPWGSIQPCLPQGTHPDSQPTVLTPVSEVPQQQAPESHTLTQYMVLDCPLAHSHKHSSTRSPSKLGLGETVHFYPSQHRRQCWAKALKKHLAVISHSMACLSIGLPWFYDSVSLRAGTTSVASPSEPG